MLTSPAYPQAGRAVRLLVFGKLAKLWPVISAGEAGIVSLFAGAVTILIVVEPYHPYMYSGPVDCGRYRRIAFSGNAYPRRAMRSGIIIFNNSSHHNI